MGQYSSLFLSPSLRLCLKLSRSNSFSVYIHSRWFTTLVLYHFALIYCIRSWYNWSFLLYHHITYDYDSVASCLFLLYCLSSLWHYLVPVFEEIHFISEVFPYLDIPNSSRVRFRLVVALNIPTVVRIVLINPLISSSSSCSSTRTNYYWFYLQVPLSDDYYPSERVKICDILKPSFLLN